MSSNRPTKQELRHDSFVEGTAKLTGYLQSHFMTVLVVIAAIAVVVVGAVFFSQSRERSRLQASQLFFRATNFYAAGNYSDALVALDDLHSRFGSTEEGREALYLAGASHLALGENDAALERFESYLSGRDAGLYVNSAKIGVGLALEGRGEWPAAEEQLREALTGLNEDDPLVLQASVALSRVLEKEGKIDAAIAVLEPLTSDPDVTTRLNAQNRISVLEALR